MADVTVVEVDGAVYMIAGDQNDAFSDAFVTFLRERIRPTIEPLINGGTRRICPQL